MNDIALLLSNIKKKKAQNKSVEIVEQQPNIQTKPLNNNNIFNTTTSISNHTFFPPPIVPPLDTKTEQKTDNKILFKALITPPKPQQTPVIKQTSLVNPIKQKKGDIQIRAPANISITRQKPVLNKIPPPPQQSHHTNVKVSNGALLNIKNAKEKRQAQMRQQLKKSVDEAEVKNEKQNQKQQEKQKQKDRQKVDQNEMQDGQIVQNKQSKKEQQSIEPLIQTQNKEKQIKHNVISNNKNPIFTVPQKKQIISSLTLPQILEKQKNKNDLPSQVINKPHPEQINQILKNIPISMEVQHQSVEHKPQIISNTDEILKPTQLTSQQQQNTTLQQIKHQNISLNTVIKPNVFQTSLQPTIFQQNIFQTTMPQISVLPPTQIQSNTVTNTISIPNSKNQLHQKLSSKQLHRLKRLQTKLSLCLEQFNQLAQLKKTGQFTTQMDRKLDIVKIALNQF